MKLRTAIVHLLLSTSLGSLVSFSLVSSVWGAYRDLPYTVRDRSYSGYATTVRGDIRTVAMAGATIGLADTQMAAFENPAGLAHALSGADVTITRNTVLDAHIQELDEAMRTHHTGAAVAIYPWGFSLGYSGMNEEGLTYYLPSLEREANLMVSTAEYRAGVARYFWEGRFSVGASVNFGEAEQSFQFLGSRGSATAPITSHAWGATLGLQTQFPGRLLVGVRYSTPMTYSIDPEIKRARELASLFGDVESPKQLSLGIGWIPSRIFQADFSLHLVGATPNVALLRDQELGVGRQFTVRPHLGLSYMAIDYREIRTEVYGGLYYEASRIQGQRNRLHVTTGLNAKMWIFSVGTGIDVSSGYRNYLASFGFDPIRVAQLLDILPPLPKPDHQGLLPNPTQLSEGGLPRPLVREWSPERGAVDPIEASRSVPAKIENQINEVRSKNLSDIGSGIIDAVKEVPSKIREELEYMQEVENRKKRRQNP